LTPQRTLNPTAVQNTSHSRVHNPVQGGLFLIQFIQLQGLIKKVIYCPVDCGIESLYRVICSVQSGSSWLRPVVMGSFHWLSWMDPHLCRAGHTAYFSSGGEGRKKKSLSKTNS